MGFMDKMMRRMIVDMSPEQKRKMMDEFLGGMSPDEKMAMMEEMMPRMMEGIDMMEMMPKMMKTMMGGKSSGDQKFPGSGMMRGGDEIECPEEVSGMIAAMVPQ